MRTIYKDEKTSPPPTEKIVLSEKQVVDVYIEALEEIKNEIDFLDIARNEGITSIREWEPGVYVIHTNKVWETLKERASKGEINSGSNAFTPSFVRELNEKAKTPEGQEEILRRLWGEDWYKHEWGK